MRIHWLVFTLVISAIGGLNNFPACAAQNIGFKDPLDTPATKIAGSLKLDRQPILAVTIVKKRIVGVGLRGLLVISDDGGKTWQQSQTPVQSDLTAVVFPTATHGWAVGHDGVVLASSDGGISWTKQLDGRIAANLFVSAYQKRVDAGETGMQRYLNQAKINAKTPAALPFLSVHFENERTGFVVGSFGLIMATQDGGKTWEPWNDHIDNDQFLNLNEIRQIGSTLYIVGERGSAWKLDRTKQHFVSISTEYRGSFFSISGQGNKLLVVGLGGNAFRSINGGESWQKVTIGTQSTLTSAITTLDGSRALVISVDGELFTSDDDWISFTHIPIEKPMIFASSLALDGSGQVILVGYRGITAISPQSILGRNSPR